MQRMTESETSYTWRLNGGEGKIVADMAGLNVPGTGEDTQVKVTLKS